MFENFEVIVMPSYMTYAEPDQDSELCVDEIIDAKLVKPAGPVQVQQVKADFAAVERELDLQPICNQLVGLYARRTIGIRHESVPIKVTVAETPGVLANIFKTEGESDKAFQTLRRTCLKVCEIHGVSHRHELIGFWLGDRLTPPGVPVPAGQVEVGQ